MGRCSSITASRLRMPLIQMPDCGNNIDVDICGVPLGMLPKYGNRWQHDHGHCRRQQCLPTDRASINIEGVRLSLVGSGRDSITASVSGTGDIRLLGGANTVTVMNSIVDELDDDGVDVATTLTLIRHTGDPEKATKFKLLIEENTVRSFDGAQINLEFSGIPDGVEVTIDAWAATAEDLGRRG